MEEKERGRVPLGLSLMVANAAMNNSTCCEAHIRDRKEKSEKRNQKEKRKSIANANVRVRWRRDVETN